MLIYTRKKLLLRWLNTVNGLIIVILMENLKPFIMKKILLFIIAVFVFVGCQKLESKEFSTYTYYTNSTDCIVEFMFDKSVTRDLSSLVVWEKTFNAADPFNYSINVVSKKTDKTITYGVKKNGVVIYENKY